MSEDKQKVASVESWRFTVIGGNENGNDFTFPSGHPVLVGRSHAADLRLSEPDVSGRHVEFALEDGGAVLRVLSRFSLHLNANELTTGQQAVVKAGDTVSIGARMRLRVDAVPRRVEPPTEEFVGDVMDDAPLAMMEESSRTGSGFGTNAETRLADMETVAVSPETGTFATRVPDEETFATRVPDEGTFATRVPDGFTAAGDEETTSGGEADKTRELETRPGSMEEILAMKAALASKNKRHKLSYLFLFVLFAAFLAAVMLVTGISRETDRMSIPKLTNGEYDLHKWVYRGESGQPLLYVEYPGNDNLTFEYLPGSNGVQVLSYMGRERDVPFFLQFEIVDRPSELKMGLEESVRAWMRRTEESGLKCMFDENELASLETQFFEDVYPGSCEAPTLYGVRFVRLEYKRPWPNGEFYHGVLIYFRRGSTVFTLRREIPDGMWVRGGRQLLEESNLAVFANFSKSYWESPGEKDLPLGESVAALMERADTALSTQRASGWVAAKKVLDAALIKTWNENPKSRDVVMAKLAGYREILRVFYNERLNKYETPQSVGDVKEMQSVRRDCLQIFQDKSERYWWLVSKEW